MAGVRLLVARERKLVDALMGSQHPLA
jgi:hypothetical protein